MVQIRCGAYESRYDKAKKYTAKDIAAQNYNIDLCGYPHEEEEILPPKELSKNRIFVVMGVYGANTLWGIRITVCRLNSENSFFLMETLALSVPILMNPPYGGNEKTEVKNHFPADLASSETATGKESTCTAGKVCNLFTNLRIDHLCHEISHSAWGIKLTGRTCALHFLQNSLEEAIPLYAVYHKYAVAWHRRAENLP